VDTARDRAPPGSASCPRRGGCSDRRCLTTHPSARKSVRGRRRTAERVVRFRRGSSNGRWSRHCVRSRTCSTSARTASQRSRRSRLLR
jgi:hypothetical protein